MLVGFFLLYLVAFTVVVYAIQWLYTFLASATATDSSTFIIAMGGMTSIMILTRYNLGGIVIVVAVLVFWSLLLFGMGTATLTPTLALAAGALYLAAAAAVINDWNGKA